MVFLLGAPAGILYGGLMWKLVLPTPYIVANYLRLVGGAGGGLMAQWLIKKNQASRV
jgi:hypothetical protein